MNANANIERSTDGKSIYLYHGTNCYRRWEINKIGAILPGRSSYSFFCSLYEDAYICARTACRRDAGGNNCNSLISEPVVLKVRFTQRLWMQADFVQLIPANESSTSHGLSIAVLGPIPLTNIEGVLNCSHGQRGHLPRVRSFADGRLADGIARLRHKTANFRADIWLFQTMGQQTRSMMTQLQGSEFAELTKADIVRRLTMEHSQH